MESKYSYEIASLAGVSNEFQQHKRKKETDTDAEKERQRNRKRRIKCLMKKSGAFPSFLAMICPESDVCDKNNNEQPQIVTIDVDEYLGLKTKSATSDADAAKKPAAIHEAAAKKPPPNAQNSTRFATNATKNQQRLDSQPPVLASSTLVMSSSTPEEEGYYEGVVGMSCHDDQRFLSPLQQLVRKHLELFSATALDAGMSKSGRRTPTVRGKVGIRCIHCSKVAKEFLRARSSHNQSNTPTFAHSITSNQLWPSGSVSYPVNIAGMYSVCSQKPQQHFQHCPNMPPSIKAQFYYLQQESKESVTRARRGGITASVYYLISAKRLGLIDVAMGIRFGRDLSLEPLPFDAILAQENIVDGAINKQSGTTSLLAAGDSFATNATPLPRITADEESEKILAKVLAEKDDEKRFVARSEDKPLVTDYIFVLIRQMAYCWVVPLDFQARGKKTKLMRIGYAGFCCRYCTSQKSDGTINLLGTTAGYDSSCRSFSSAPDNLASAISNSFASHLSKCEHVPAHIRTALVTYKKLHPRQMAQFPYGSQRRLYHLLWQRLRAADMQEDILMQRIQNESTSTPLVPPPLPIPSITVSNDSNIGSTNTLDNVDDNNRPSSYPVCEDPETQAILKAAEDNWDPNLFHKGERYLVSDYVFLAMRNLKVAFPQASDFTKGKRSTITQLKMAGMCCIHCHDKTEMVAPSARSFPSVPDNFASALNTSLYNHMQNCQYVPSNLKRALAQCRKMHSIQCSSLKFGSQRRFFSSLFDRLRKIPVPKVEYSAKPSRRSHGGKHQRSVICNKSNLNKYGFFEAPCQTFLCRRCRMIPMQFRARGSLCFERPSLDFAMQHFEICKEDGFDLWFVSESLHEVVKTNLKSNLSLVSSNSFKDVVQQVMGGNELLTKVFTDGALDVIELRKKQRKAQPTVEPGRSDLNIPTKGLWRYLPHSVDYEKITKSFKLFAESVPGMSNNLRDHDALVRYFLLISPSFALPDEHEEIPSKQDPLKADTALSHHGIN